MNTIKNYTPFSFQKNSIKKGISILNNYNGLFVMDETGLGKTITVTTILKNIELENKSLLIISPNIHKPTWLDIMKKADINAIVSGNRKIPTENFDYIVIDEAHNIGTKKGKTYKELFKKIHLNQTKVILISATPYNNNISAFVDLCALIPFPLNSSPFYMLHYWGMAAMNQEKEHQKALRFDSGGNGMEGNFWDFHNGCHGLYKFDRFNSVKEFINVLKNFHEAKGETVEISYSDYKSV